MKRTANDPRVDQAIQEFQAIWGMGTPHDKRAFADRFSSLETIVFRELVWVEYLCRWKFDNQPEPVEAFLNRNPEHAAFWSDKDLVLKLIDIEMQFGGGVDSVRLKERFPSLENQLSEVLAGYEQARAHPTVHEGAISNDPSATTAPGNGPPQTPRPPDLGNLEPESVLCVEDRYRILRLLNDGGQKYVYEAHQINPGRVVALKTPKNPASSSSMMMEGQVIAQMEHQNIPPIMNLAKSPEQGVQVILAEKFIPGTSWNDYLQGQKAQLKSTPDKDRPRLMKNQLKENLRYLLDVCDALAYAHGDLKVIHRDLKPANVMLNRFNDRLGRYTETYVVDWGLALFVGDEGGKVPAPHRTNVKSFSGTPCYAAPEMWEGVGQKLGTATDVFLLGGILYELLVGTPPYIDKHMVIMSYKGRLATIPPPEQRAPERAFPRELSHIAMRALSADPKDRYADAAEFAQAIEQHLKHADAEDKTREAEERLKAIQDETATLPLADKHTSISKFIEVADQFRQAGRSWEGTAGGAAAHDPEYRKTLEGERRARLALVDLAEQTGDFALAESQLDVLKPLPAPFGDDLDGYSTRILAKAAQRRRARTLTVGAVLASVLLLLGLVGAIVGMFGERNLKMEAEGRRQAEEKSRKEAEARERAEGIQRAVAEENAELAKKARDAAKALAAQKTRVAESQPWFTRAAIRHDERFQQGAAVYLAKGLAIQPEDDNARVRLKETTQRALVPVAWSSQRIPVASLAYSPDGKHLMFGDNDVGKIRVLDLPSGDQIHAISVHEINNDSDFFGTVRKIAVHASFPGLCFSIGQDGKVQCCDFIKGERIAHGTTPGADKMVPFLGFDIAKTPMADGKLRMVTCDAAGRLILWTAQRDAVSDKVEIQAGKIVSVGKEKEILSAVSMHPQGSLIAVGTLRQRVLLFDGDGTLVADLSEEVKDEPLGRINDVAFSPSGDRLAAAGQDGVISIWDVAARKLAFRLKGHEASFSPAVKGDRNWVWRLAFAPSGRLFSTGDDGVLREWDIQTGSEVPRSPKMQHESTVYGGKFAAPICVRPDGTELASAGMDGRIRLWDASSGKLKAQTEGVRPGSLLSVLAAAHCPRKDLLITCGLSLDAQVRLWDTKNLTEIRTVRPILKPQWGDPSDFITAAGIDPDGSRFAVGSARGDLFFFKTDAEAPSFTIEAAHTVPANVARALKDAPFSPAMILMDWSRDGREVVTVGMFDRKWKIWDPATGKLKKEWPLVDPDRQPNQVEKLTGIPGQITTALAFDPDGKHILTGTSDGQLYRWEMETGKLAQRFAASTGSVMRIAFTKEGKWALTGGEEQVLLWDWIDRKPVRSTILPALVPDAMSEPGKGIQQGFQRKMTGTVFGLAFTPDAGHMVATLHDGSVTVIDTLSGAILHRSLCSPYMRKGDGVFCYFTKDQEIITVDTGGLTRWDLLGGRRISEFAFTGGIEGQRIAAAPDGKQWATRTIIDVTLWNQAPNDPPFLNAKKASINPFELKEWPNPVRPNFEGKNEPTPDTPTAVAYSPDNRLLVVGNNFGSAVVWDRDAEKIRAVFKAPRPYRELTPTHYTDVETITAIAIHPEGRVVATNAQGSLVSTSPFEKSDPPKSIVDLWSSNDGKLITTLEWNGERIVSLAFRPGGKDLAALASDGVVTVWDWDAKMKRFSVRGAARAGTAGAGLVYSLDGSHFVQAGMGGDFSAVRADDGTTIQRWQGHLPGPLGNMAFGSRAVSCLAFDKNGKLLSAGSDAMLRTWIKDDKDNYREVDSISTLRLSNFRARGPEVRENKFLGTREFGMTAERAKLQYLVIDPSGQYLVTGGLSTGIKIIPTGKVENGADELSPRDTERKVGLRLDGEQLVPRERNRLIWISKKK